MTTIYDALKSDHEQHRDLLRKLDATQGDSAERRKLWERFYYEVGAHAAAEELTFYSRLISKSEAQSEGRHSVAEHKELEDSILGLHEMDFSSPGWLARLKILRARYEHHIDEEEDDIFPVAREVIGADEEGTIGAEFAERKSEERKLVDEKAENALEE